VQSLIRDHGQRALLLDLSQALGSLETARVEKVEIQRVAGIYHRLVQMWAEP